MNAQTNKPGGESTSSLFSASILKPSILSDGLKTSDVNAQQMSKEEGVSGLAKPLIESPKFKTADSVTKPIETSGDPGYVFGQNMGSRVVNAHQGASENIWQAFKSTDCDSQTASVFTTLAKAVAQKTEEKPRCDVLLEDSAVVLAQKRKAAQMVIPDGSSLGSEIITGEEDERITMELTCNAYVFDRDSKQWKGIGQSYLHLNDGARDSTTSRLIIRLQSTRRVVVNTRIWAEMPVAHVPENKAVRVGALSSVAVSGEETTGAGSIRTYMLRFANAESARQLYEALEERREASALKETTDSAAKRPRLAQESSVTTLAVPCASDTAKDTTNAVPVIVEPPTAVLTKEPAAESQHHAEVVEEEDGRKSTTLTAMSFPCRRVLFYSASSGHVTEKLEAELSSQPVATVTVTDFPQTGNSILEVAAPEQGTLLTAAIGSRLAFCRSGEMELHLFCVTPKEEGDAHEAESDGEREESRDSVSSNGTGSDRNCRIQLASATDAERLYRSLLLRIARLFMATSGIINEAQGANGEQPTSEQVEKSD